ncbi:MAG: three-Cys-motif partner protein TcmP [Planctomycetales bacterium]
MTEPDLYAGSEQTKVKHFVLRSYLAVFARIVGSRWNAITYVDCFAGPWKEKSEKFEDSSFAIALDELRKARDRLSKGQPLKLRCFFLEKDRKAYAKLKAFADEVTDAEVVARNSDLENSIDEILSFVAAGGRNAFPFIFIDPTGWTGFAMNTIAPLLRLRPGEVLINFMTNYIRRFIESPNRQTQESFESLFGSKTHRELIAGLPPAEREDAIVRLYAENVKRTGNFEYACSAIVLNPVKDRTHFHLTYATRSEKGVEKFKEVEKSAMEEMERTRADAQQRTRTKKTNQPELFGSEVRYASTRYDELRERYLTQARSEVESMLRAKGRMRYDDVWTEAMSFSLVWASDLKSWIEDWQKQGRLRIEGMTPRQQKPKRRAGNFLVWEP